MVDGIRQCVCFSKKKQFVGILMGIVFLTINLYMGFSLRAGMVLSALTVLASAVKVGEVRQKRGLFYLICALALAFFDFVCVQFGLNVGIAEISLFGICCNVLCVFIFMLVGFLITLDFRISAIVGLCVPMFLATVNYYVYQFRGSELQPIDLLSLKTAMNVSDAYQVVLQATIFYAWVVVGILVLLIFVLPDFRLHGIRLRIVALVSEATLISFVLMSSSRFYSFHWKMQGSIFNGYLLNFTGQIKECIISKPAGYSADTIEGYESDYLVEAEEETDCPAIIVIMDESFSDFSVLGSELCTNVEVTPYIDSLSENTIRGYALSSVIGGGTPNSEFEFLTGNTMAFLPSGSIAYQQYVKSETASLVSALKRFGYSTLATHPYLSSGWMRTTVYPLLQFDAYSFMEDYPQRNLLRTYISDQEMFEYIVQSYEDRDEDSSFFLFGVSMQNHGGYEYDGDDFETTIHLEGYEGDYPKVEQYLSAIHETDSAVEYLISYFAEVDEPVVIVFYGDHLPSLDAEFYEEVHGGSFDTLDEQELEYTVPFFIWANYDIEEQEVELTSLNYLSTYVMEVAGLQKTAYQEFLTDVMAVIPAINSRGYYSVSNGCFLSIEDAEGEEAEMLQKYWQIQYNGMFDADNRSQVFFPLTD